MNMTILFFCFLFLSWNLIDMAAVGAENTKILVNVGAVVDVANASNPSLTGKIYLSSIKMALSDLYASHAHFKTRLVLTNRSCKGSVVGAASAALDLMKNEKVKAILGPVTSTQTSFVVNLGDQAQVPILSFSATSPSLTSLRSSYFFLMAETDLYQVKAISSIVKNFGWRQVIPIYVDNTYGQSVIPYLIDALQEVDAHVPYRSVIPPSPTDDQIEKELIENLMATETRVFIVHMMPQLSSRIFAKAKELGMMSKGYVWIMTNGVGDRLWTIRSDALIMNSMQGVLGVETYVPSTKELQEVATRWKRQFRQDNPTIVDDVDLDVYGLRAYDAAFALALAVEQVGNNTSFGFQNRNNASSTDLYTFKESQYGPKLAHALSKTTFKGLAGEFKLKDRQLRSSTIRIVNVNGDGVRTIAFWTPENGLVKTLNSTSPCTVASTSNKCDLGPVLWPGDSHYVPKGWEIPTKGNKLRIGVPLKFVFTEFVNVTKNSSTNTTSVTGFSIDVFKAALKELPYDLPYELIPFKNPDGKIAGTFDDLVYQVYLKKFDAVVGDITIRENRSLYVDFTMPYTESGVVMVVPIRDTGSKNAWVFLKPLTWDLWLTTLCFFVFIGFVIWVLEHGVNEDFRGPPLHQVGTSFWFSFSTMVFSHRERVVSNLAKILITVWVFVVLVLTQSYTANLASLLTVEQLRPTVTNIKELIRNRDNVGYLNGSFVHEFLKQIGFHESNLKAMNSMKQCEEALSKGSEKGGITAFVDETPNMKLFLAKQCAKYTMIGPIFKSNGFAFAFPKRSPLVPVISQAILNVTEGENMMNITKKWFSQETNCLASNSSTAQRVTSNNTLGLESFWGLFLIVGMASILALFISAASFLYEHRHVLEGPDSRASKWKRVRALFQIFNEKDLNCHVFKGNQNQNEMGGDRDEVEASPNSNWSESPLSYNSNHVQS